MAARNIMSGQTGRALTTDEKIFWNKLGASVSSRGADLPVAVLKKNPKIVIPGVDQFKNAAPSGAGRPTSSRTTAQAARVRRGRQPYPAQIGRQLCGSTRMATSFGGRRSRSWTRTGTSFLPRRAVVRALSLSTMR